MTINYNEMKEPEIDRECNNSNIDINSVDIGNIDNLINLVSNRIMSAEKRMFNLLNVRKQLNIFN